VPDMWGITLGRKDLGIELAGGVEASVRTVSLS
jgi:hypothetical protein